jgi:hypothetical protein
MRGFTKGSPKIRFEFVPAKKQSTLSGQPALEALAQQFDLWNKTPRPGTQDRSVLARKSVKKLQVPSSRLKKSSRPRDPKSCPAVVQGRRSLTLGT